MTSIRSPRAERPRRFARVGRVVPVALLQIGGTLAVAHAGGLGRDGTGPPWAGSAPDAAAEPLSAFAVVLLVAGVVVLPFRWRWPVAVLGIVLATTVGFGLVGSARGPFVVALTMALVNAWFRGHRLPVAVAAAVAFLVLPTADLLTGRSAVVPWGAFTLTLAWLTATIALTELARVRSVRADEARAARVEAERRRAGDERVRIARELHDSVAHNMSLINLQAGVALHLGDDLPDQTRTSLTNIRDASRDALVELRTVLGVLRAVDAPESGDRRSARTPTPGLDRLPDLVERARAAGVDVALRIVGDPGSVSGTVDRSAFRIVQESVTNVMKHAPGHRVDITVGVGPDTVDLDVVDRAAPSGEHGSAPGSVGLDAPVGVGASGNGIIGMRERAVAVGGDFTAGPAADGSWRVHARLPIGAPPLTTTTDHHEEQDAR